MWPGMNVCIFCYYILSQRQGTYNVTCDQAQFKDLIFLGPLFIRFYAGDTGFKRLQLFFNKCWTVYHAMFIEC